MNRKVSYSFTQVVSEDLNFTKHHSVEYCSTNSTTDEAEQAVADEVSRYKFYLGSTEVELYSFNYY